MEIQTNLESAVHDLILLIGFQAHNLPTPEDSALLALYQSLHCKLKPIGVRTPEFAMIKRYMDLTHSKVHNKYSASIINIFEVFRDGEAERFLKFASNDNKMLLWHGSRLTNWTGILKEGLRIAPPEAPSTGSMFGKGSYFSDMFSKSANYSLPSPPATDGVIALCEVALGDMVELTKGKSDANNLPEGKLSTKGVGLFAPDPSKHEILNDGVVVPLGEPVQQLDQKGALLHNEYVVYNVDQIKIRYVLQIEFVHKKLHTVAAPRNNLLILSITVFIFLFLCSVYRSHINTQTAT